MDTFGILCIVLVTFKFSTGEDAEKDKPTDYGLATPSLQGKAKESEAC